MKAEIAEIEFFFDVVSPYTWLATHRIDELAAQAGLPVRWRPFFLGGVMKATGNTPPALLPARGRYMFRDLHRWAGRVKAELNFPTVFPTHSLPAMRALCAMPQDQAMVAAARALFRAYWTEGRDIRDPAVIAEITGPQAVAAAGQDAAKERLRAWTDEAVARGAFGAPTFFVGEQMFFGNDRMDFVAEAVRAAL